MNQEAFPLLLAAAKYILANGYDEYTAEKLRDAVAKVEGQKRIWP